MRLIPIFVLTAIVAVSCGTSRSGSSPATPPQEEIISATPIELTSTMPRKEIDKGKLQFATEFFKATLKESPTGTVVISPYSAGMAFSMLAEGAVGKTKSDLFQALCGSSYYGDYPFTDTENIVKTANSAWLVGDFDIKENYASTIESGYGAQIYSSAKGDPITVEAINKWCENHTEGLIDKLIEKLDPSVRMILMNALYFKAPWMVTFKPENTANDVFHGEKGDNVVPFMKNSSKVYGYAYADGCTYVSLPYKNGKYAMLIAMPDDISKAGEILENKGIENAVLTIRPNGETILKLPKFKVEYDIVLNGIMKTLGAEIIFGGYADFSDMTSEKLCVTQAIQKCVLEVNEEGAEAAAVTAIFLGRTSLPASEPRRVTIDKPFLFAIYDVESKLILFEGKIADLQ